MRTTRLLRWFCEECSEVAASKGHDGETYGFLAGALTIGLGVLAAVIGSLIIGEFNRYWPPLLYFGGSAVGACASWIIVSSLKNITKPYEPTPLAPHIMPRQSVSGLPCGRGGPVWCIKCGRKLPPESERCDACGAEVPKME